MENQINKEKIISTLKTKSVLKQDIFDKTVLVFESIKEIITEIVEDYNKDLKNEDNRVHLRYQENSDFSLELKIAGDLLFFSMHSNVFEFPNYHEIFKNSYYKDHIDESYCGIISIYNFLSDSFKYERNDDEGYLFGRIFINKDSYFFTDGLPELGYSYPSFKNNKATKENLKNVIEAAIAYALKFDLFVPNFNDVSTLYVTQMKTQILDSKIKTGKRMGFQYEINKDKE